MPAVPDVLMSGRNVGALRQAREVYSSGEPADDISQGPIIFVTPIALTLLKFGPNSKQGK